MKHGLTDADLESSAVISPYATGASIKNMVNEALIHAIEEDRDTITWPDILAAKHVEQHGLPDEWEYIDRERHAVAIHEACHAVAFYRLSTRTTIDVATIERRGETGGFVQWIPDEDRFSTWKSDAKSTSWCRSPRSPASGCSSTATTRPVWAETWASNCRRDGDGGIPRDGCDVGSHRVTKLEGINDGIATGTDRMWLETEFGIASRPACNSSLPRSRSCSSRDRTWVLAVARTQWKPEKQSRARTWSRSSRATRARRSTAARTTTLGSRRSSRNISRAALTAHKASDTYPAIPFPVPAGP